MTSRSGPHIRAARFCDRKEKTPSVHSRHRLTRGKLGREPTQMQYRKMGSLDWEVSALGFGCMRLPPRRLNRLRAETEESIRIIRHGIDLGINYVDTAWPYHLGDSERLVGQALQDGYRERVHLVTKLPMFVVWLLLPRYVPRVQRNRRLL
jgi:hypothetical protein